MNRINRYLGSFCCVLGFCACSHSPAEMSLEGEWAFALDSLDVGVAEQWPTKTFTDVIPLPGTTDDAGYGIPNTLPPSIEKPQVLHLTRKHSYVGPAWYSKEVEIPEAWDGKQVELELERVIWGTSVWVDGQAVEETQESLVAPHRYDLTAYLSPGKHRITVRVDNRERYAISTGGMAHAYTDHTQIRWNGIIGEVKLAAKDAVSIEQVQAYPDNKRGEVKFVVHIDNAGEATEAVVRVEESQQTLSLQPGMNEVELVHPMQGAYLVWNEFTPNLYHADVTVKTKDSQDTYPVTYAFREWRHDGNRLLLNGNPVFLRGTLECCIFPLTGYPPMESAGWRKVFETAREWGLNHLRFHSWCPPEAAFAVADSMGMYLQVELPLWEAYTKENAGFLQQEAENILKEYGNHPSFCFFSMGNELWGDFEGLQQLVADLKKEDDRRLYTMTSFSFSEYGEWPEPNSDFFITQRTKKGWVRGQGVFDAEPPRFDKDYAASVEGMRVPLITHEMGQYAVYPDLKEIEKYTGVLDPLNFKGVKADLEKKGLLDKADDYLMASGKLAELLYKEEIERSLKTNGIAGFQLLDLHDFPGQGSALVGLLNAFWESKGITEAEQFRQFCSPVVPLAYFPKAVYTAGETLEIGAKIANYSDKTWEDMPVRGSLATWDGHVVSEWDYPAQGIALGMNELDAHTVTLPDLEEAKPLRLTIELPGTPYRNSWNIWVYPNSLSVEKGDIVLTADFSEAERALQAGKKVFLNPPYEQLKGLEGKFVPVFWSPVHFPKQAGTMGLLLDNHHPAFAHFPTASHTDWKWWNLVKHSRTLCVDSLYRQLTPLVECVDNFANNRRLTNLFETKAGKGKLIFCTLDLLRQADQHPEAKQLLYSLVEYMKSDDFQPSATLSVPLRELKTLE